MPPLSGTETILVVDSELTLLSLSVMMLDRYGYHAIAAANATEALQLFEMWPDIEVDLFMINLVLPEMKGQELAERIQSIRPGTPVLYIVNYSDPETPRGAEVAQSGVRSIARPFTSVQLTRSIRAVLDNPQATSAAG